jgi:hypothetical protein
VGIRSVSGFVMNRPCQIHAERGDQQSVANDAFGVQMVNTVDSIAYGCAPCRYVLAVALPCVLDIASRLANCLDPVWESVVAKEYPICLFHFQVLRQFMVDLTSPSIECHWDWLDLFLTPFSD